jgi:mRNA interferase RelE/StbE
MTWSLAYSKGARKFLQKLDVNTSRIIVAWMEKNINGCENPRMFGQALTGGLKGLWRYRIGDFRVITRIEDDRVLVFVIEIGHRSTIYKTG